MLQDTAPEKDAASKRESEVSRPDMKSQNWTREQLKLAFNLYCQLPFGKLHKGNAEIVELASLIGRTPSAVAMKLVNFASLDPAITNSGRTGLGNASALDREVWDEFNANWDKLVAECAALQEQLQKTPQPVQMMDMNDEFDLEDFTGETRRVLVEQRVKQNFFRRSVLASYRGRCCMSGVTDSRLLVASHIVPWRQDRQNRLNPRNGLCLSAIHDKAFDRGLIALTDDYRVLVSDELRRSAFVESVLVPLAGKIIELPERFAPEPDFIRLHRQHVFLSAA